MFKRPRDQAEWEGAVIMISIIVCFLTVVGTLAVLRQWETLFPMALGIVGMGLVGALILFINFVEEKIFGIRRDDYD